MANSGQFPLCTYLMWAIKVILTILFYTKISFEPYNFMYSVENTM